MGTIIKHNTATENFFDGKFAISNVRLFDKYEFNIRNEQGYYEIVHFYSDSESNIQLTIDGIDVELSLNDNFIFVQSGIEVSLKPSSTLNNIYCIRMRFKENFIAKILNFIEADFERIFKHKVQYYSEQSIQELNKLIKKIIDEYENVTGTSNIDILFCEFFNILKQPTIRYGMSVREGFFINGLVEYINRNYFDDMSLEKLSVKFLTDKYKICREFKKKIGIGILEYTRTLRINHAKEYLEKTKLSINSIAKKVGYDNNVSFSRIFKECCGFTPIQYRRKYSLLKVQRKPHEMKNVDGKNVFISECTTTKPGDMARAHKHNYYEIVQYTACETDSAGYILYTNGRRYLMNDNSISFTRPGVMHIIYRTDVVKRTLINVKPEIMEEIFAFLGIDIESFCAEPVKTHSVEEKAYINKIYCVLLEQVKFEIMIDIVMCKIQIAKLLHLLSQCQTKVISSESVLHVQNAIINYIETNYNEHLTLDFLSLKFNKNKSVLFKSIKRYTGVNYSDFLQQIRIKRACEKMENSNQSLKEIALSCGFLHYSTFHISFKKEKGLTPGQYRKTLHNEMCKY